MLPAAPSAGERFWFPVQTKAADGGTKPEPSGSCSVSSAPSRIAFQRVKGARRTFQRGRLRCYFPRRRLLLKLSCIFQGFPHPHTRTRSVEKPTAYRQARLNSRNLTNIAIPFTHRQWQLVASDGNGAFISELTDCRIEIDELLGLVSRRDRAAGFKHILRYAQDFGARLGRRVSAETC